jgi:hypothetical protein
MMALINQNASGEITGWMIASDIHELRHRAEQAWGTDIASTSYALDTPPLGATHIAPGITLLVE